MGWDGWKGWDGGIIQLAGCAKLLAGWDGSDGWSQPGYHSNPRVGSGSSSLSACTCVESRTRPRRTRTPTLRMRLALSFIVYVADCFGSVTSVYRRLLCLGSGCVARVSSFSDALALSRAPLILGRAAAHRVGDGHAPGPCNFAIRLHLPTSPGKRSHALDATRSFLLSRFPLHPRQAW